MRAAGFFGKFTPDLASALPQAVVCPHSARGGQTTDSDSSCRTPRVLELAAVGGARESSPTEITGVGIDPAGRIWSPRLPVSQWRNRAPYLLGNGFGGFGHGSGSPFNEHVPGRGHRLRLRRS